MAAFLDVCRFLPTAGGTADWTYSSAVAGYQGPTAAGAVNAAVYRYRAESADLSQWEIGFGAYNSGTGVFARTTVLFNSSGTTAKINFSVAPQVAIVALAEDLATFLTAAVKADQTTGTSTAVGVTPAVQQNHTSAVKAWAHITRSGTSYTLAGGYNIASVVRNSLGSVTVNFTTPFTSTGAYCANPTPNEVISGVQIAESGGRTTSAITFDMRNTFSPWANVDCGFDLVCLGTQ
jgi:hypothetical protein